MTDYRLLFPSPLSLPFYLPFTPSICPIYATLMADVVVLFYDKVMLLRRPQRQRKQQQVMA